MYSIDRRKISCRIYIFFTDVCKEDCIPLRLFIRPYSGGLGTLKERKICVPRKTNRYSQSALDVNGGKRSFEQVTESKCDNRRIQGHFRSGAPYSYGPEITRKQSQKKSPRSFTAIFHRGRNDSVPGMSRSL